MTKIPFVKSALTSENLLAKLKNQGLIVAPADELAAQSYFRFVGAYRLKGYWFKLLDPATKSFPQGYDFLRLRERVEFDRALRAETSRSIEILEIALRTVISNSLSVKHGPHWFLNSNIFKPTRNWGLGQLIKKIEDEVGRSSERAYVSHYFANHDEPYLPPSWSITECVSFGLWSRTYQILKDPNDKKAISKKFNIDKTEVFESWLHALSVTRNAVAHHSQILGKKLSVTPSNYKAANIQLGASQTFFAIATVINHLLVQTGLPQTWKTDLQTMFARFPTINPVELGFPVNWANKAGW